jgi:hypothetical protein
MADEEWPSARWQKKRCKPEKQEPLAIRQMRMTLESRPEASSLSDKVAS